MNKPTLENFQTIITNPQSSLQDIVNAMGFIYHSKTSLGDATQALLKAYQRREEFNKNYPLNENLFADRILQYLGASPVVHPGLADLVVELMKDAQIDPQNINKILVRPFKDWAKVALLLLNRPQVDPLVLVSVINKIPGLIKQTQEINQAQLKTFIQTALESKEKEIVLATLNLILNSDEYGVIELEKTLERHAFSDSELSSLVKTLIKSNAKSTVIEKSILSLLKHSKAGPHTFKSILDWSELGANYPQAIHGKALVLILKSKNVIELNQSEIWRRYYPNWNLEVSEKEEIISLLEKAGFKR